MTKPNDTHDDERDTEVLRCQHVSPTPWGASQCALPLNHEGRHAYSPSEALS